MTNEIRPVRSKKVEYLELIYDLIFVFLLQQDNSLLELDADGFFSVNAFFTYLYSSLIVLQVWVFSTMYINRYGENTIMDHIFLFANMYLLYFMGVETRVDWWTDYQAYNSAWALILINITIQYLLQARRVKSRHPNALRLTYTRAILYLIDAVLVLLTIPIYHATQISLVWLALLVGFVGPFITHRIEDAVPISFEHLSERVMLFVVFTFGEMIVSISTYFGDTYSSEVMYFSITAFLTVIGLFMSYGYLYNNVMDRERKTNGKIYLLIHIVVLIGLSNICVALEHIRNPEVNELQNTLFLDISLISYYWGVFFVARRTERIRDIAAPFVFPAVSMSTVFFIVILLVHRNPWIVMAVTTAYTLMMYGMIVHRWRQVLRKHSQDH